jgi:glycosyltransferase involved in cell wall biosynthesis
MKFLLVSPFTSISGSAVRFWHIAQHLEKQGHSVVYVERVPPNSPPAHLKGITYIPCPTLGNLFLDIAFSLFFNLLVLVRHRDCSVFYALKPAPNNGIPALVARLAGKRIMLDIDDLDYGYFGPGFKRAISRFFFDRLPKRFELVTCHTDSLRSYIINELGAHERRVHFLPQGVSDIFVDAEMPKWDIRPKKSMVYAATLGITSDFDLLLPMLVRLHAEMPDLRVTVVGDGVRRASFESRVHESGLAEAVTFTGRVPHDELPALIAGHRVGINYMAPTLTNNCRAILKIREYLACGLQVVCNDTGDARAFEPYVAIGEGLEEMEEKLRVMLHGVVAENIEGRKYVRKHLRWDAIIDNLLRRIENQRSQTGGS